MSINVILGSKAVDFAVHVVVVVVVVNVVNVVNVVVGPPLNLNLLKASIEFLWGGGVGWGGVVRSHFHVQPNYSVEVVFCCVVVGVVIIGIILGGEHDPHMILSHVV